MIRFNRGIARNGAVSDYWIVSQTSFRRLAMVLHRCVVIVPGAWTSLPPILVINDPETEPRTSEQSLQLHYGLTATEAKFVAVFVQEASLQATAERLSLTKSSARTYLKRIFAKTEVNSQAALMKLALNGSVMLRSR